MHTSYTVGVSTGDFKALQYVMVDQQDWIETAICQREALATK